MPSAIYIKRYSILLLVLLIGVYTPLAAEARQGKHTALASEGTVSGDFVMYRDYSWKNPTWIGFLYYDDNTYGAMLYTPATNSRVTILFSCEVENKQLVLTGQKMMSPITPDDTVAVNYLMTILPTLYAQRMLPTHTSGLFARAQTKAEDDTFGGAVTLQFENYIPLFHLKSLTNNAKGLVLELAEFGSIQSDEEPLFYAYKPPEPKPSTPQFTLAKNRTKEPVTLYGVELQLDSQWKKIADNSFLCGDTAFLMVTPLSVPKTGSDVLKPQVQLLRYFLSSSPTVKGLYPHACISGTEKQFTIEQLVYDVKLQKLTKDIKHCIKHEDGTYLIISLTVDNAAYSAQTEYFHGLFPFL
ncbi:MAG: hypothetical protein ACTTJ7_06430 [Treponema sp.]